MSITQSVALYGVLPSAGKVKAKELEVTYAIGASYPIIGLVSDPNGRPKKRQIFNKVQGVKLARSNIMQFIKTDKGERVMQPEFGMNLKRYLFEHMDQTLFSNMTKDISASINAFFPSFKILKISVSEHTKNTNVNGLSLNLSLFDSILGPEPIEIGAKIK